MPRRETSLHWLRPQHAGLQGHEARSDMTLEEKIRVLPNELQREVEDFTEFLLVKRRRAELERTAVANGSPKPPWNLALN